MSIRLLLSIAIAAYPLLGNAASCVVQDKDNVLSLDLVSFDQTAGKGWRVLQDSGCFLEAANLIDEYVARHGRSYTLSFHAGQLLLKSGDYTAARAKFALAKRNDLPPERPLKWNEFVDAYVAYINDDRQALQLARDAIAVRSDFLGNKKNLEVVDRLLAKLGRPYAEIFSER